MKRETLQVDNHDIRYEFRINRALVIFTSLSDDRLNAFADALEQCSQVQQITSLKRYDSGLSAIVGVMNHSYSELTARNEINKTFKEIMSCRATA